MAAGWQNRNVTPDLVLISAASFIMGNDHARTDERPAHRVRLEAFRASRRPVLNADYARYLERTGAGPAPFWHEPRFNAPDQPVVGIDWYTAVAYCDWLRRDTSIPYRLPTEAEREYAARGGLESADWPWPAPPETQPRLADIAHLDRPHPPRSDCANGYGLMCMADNVHEWCSDWYDPAYYARSPADAPSGPPTGKRRASRGGAWRHQIKFNRVSARSSLDPTFRYNDYGFRAYADA